MSPLLDTSQPTPRTAAELSSSSNQRSRSQGHRRAAHDHQPGPPVRDLRGGGRGADHPVQGGHPGGGPSRATSAPAHVQPPVVLQTQPQPTLHERLEFLTEMRSWANNPQAEIAYLKRGIARWIADFDVLAAELDEEEAVRDEFEHAAMLRGKQLATEMAMKEALERDAMSREDEGRRRHVARQAVSHRDGYGTHSAKRARHR